MGAAIRRGFDFLVRQGHKLGRIDFEDEPRRKVVGIMQLLGLVPQSLEPSERLIRSPRCLVRRDLLRGHVHERTQRLRVEIREKRTIAVCVRYGEGLDQC